MILSSKTLIPTLFVLFFAYIISALALAVLKLFARFKKQEFLTWITNSIPTISILLDLYICTKCVAKMPSSLLVAVIEYFQAILSNLTAQVPSQLARRSIVNSCTLANIYEEAQSFIHNAGNKSLRLYGCANMFFTSSFQSKYIM